MEKPTIRFKGYTEDWEQRKLGDNIVEYTEKTTENNQYPVLTSSRKGNFFQTDYYDGNQIASADNTGYNIVPYGYFTYRHMSDDEIFHFNINDIAENGIVSTLYPVFTTDENLDSRYLQYQLNYGREFSRYAILQKQGGSRTYMYLNKLRNLYLTVPTAIEEQKKISEYFTNLDHLITLHQRKCEETKILKKYMLQKMFPQNGQKVPEIRFKGFTEDWEQRKLGDISSLITKGSTPKDKSGTGEVNFIKVENINDFSGDIVSMSKISLEEHQGYLKRSQLQEGDILFSIAGTLGRVTSVNKAILPANTNQALSIIRLKEGNLEYVKTCLKGNVVADFIRRNPTIGAQPNLSLEQVSNLEIEIPSEAEQEKIGLYFSNLDNLITLHQRKYEELKNIKKFMLQNMFV
ncbi:MAG: restriction endonuclease subunit S [Mediterraneibacter faecis]